MTEPTPATWERLADVLNLLVANDRLTLAEAEAVWADAEHLDAEALATLAGDLEGRVTGRPLLRAREVAETLGLSVETVLRWTRRGVLPGFRLPGGALRYEPEAIDAWLAARRVGEEAGDGHREVSPTRHVTRPPGAYAPGRPRASAAPEVESLLSPTPPPVTAARTEE